MSNYNTIAYAVVTRVATGMLMTEVAAVVVEIVVVGILVAMGLFVVSSTVVLVTTFRFSPSVVPLLVIGTLSTI